MTPGDRRLLSLVFLSAGVLVGFGEISNLALACVLISVLLALHSMLNPSFGPRLPRSARVGLVLILALTGLLYVFKLPVGVVIATVATQTAAILVLSINRLRETLVGGGAIGAADGAAAPTRFPP